MKQKTAPAHTETRFDSFKSSSGSYIKMFGTSLFVLRQNISQREKCMEENYAYEKLGLFYLGREIDLASMTPSLSPLLYKSRDLTTHAAIIGMTGSGKTGLGIGLIEEAIMDNIPSIIIDPKGDMGNLLLAFPNLLPEDFKPWIDPAEAARKGLGVDEYAVKTAEEWQQGLASWDQGKERIRALCNKAEMTIYTPGSSAGIPVSVLSSFGAPAEAILADTDTLNSLVNSTTTSLLTLVNVNGDQLQSREHILLSSVLLHSWRKGEDLTIEKLIGAIVSPPFDKVGVFPLDTFYGQSDRMQLAMSLNTLLANPSFSAWLSGKPLDIQRILYTEDGRPRTAIFSIAHLSESERMFFVTMLLSKFLDWMRRQQGTSSLRALLYMDEIFGYFPPTSNPPSKKPMLLLLKQARAYGCGVVLATQNPVDLDYKGLANIGTWFVGRLQTNQDQDKVAEGIAGGSDGRLDRTKVKALLSSMKGRQFLLGSVHGDEPILFETRWVMSYLKGPVAAKDIKLLMANRQTAVTPAVVSAPAAGAEVQHNLAETGDFGGKPVLSPDIKQYYLLQNVTQNEVVFEPWLAAESRVRFYNASRNIDEMRAIRSRLYLDECFDRPEWQDAEQMPCELSDCVQKPPAESRFYSLPSAISRLKDLQMMKKSFVDHLYQTERLELFRVSSLKLESKPNELQGDFRVRLQDVLREKKDDAIEKLRKSYETKQQQIEQRLQNAMYKLEKEQMDVKTKTADTVFSFGVAIVGALFGRKTASVTSISRAATGMRNAGKVVKEKGDVQRAEEQIAELQQELHGLALEIEERMAALADSFDVESYEIESFTIKPRKSDIYEVQVALLWEMSPAGR